MRTNIPSFRLPGAVLDEEVERIVDFGVETRFGHEVKSLKARARRRLRRRVRRHRRAEGQGPRHPRPQGSRREHPHRHRLADLGRLRPRRKIGKRVVVIGGGNTAMDCCRTALRLGAEAVTVTVRSPRKVMKASDWEIKDAMHEGIPILDNHAPKEFVHRERQARRRRVREDERDRRRRQGPAASSSPPASSSRSTATTC